MPQPTFASDPVLSVRFAAAGITLVDIGARGEVRPEFAALAPVARLVACEPDVEEAAVLRGRLAESGAWSRATVITEAIWPEPGEITLHITRAPGLSSVRAPDPAVTSRYANTDAFTVTGTVKVPAVTLDAAADRYNFRDATLLKLDTQGTELDILRSGEAMLASTLGVYLEVEFRPLYSGQAVFSEVDAHMRARGFELFDLHRSWQRTADFEADIVSRRQLCWAHCLYLRNPDTVSDLGGETAMRYVALAASYQHFDTALRVAKAADLGQELVTSLLAHARRVTKWMTRRSDDPGPLFAASAKDSRR